MKRLAILGMALLTGAMCWGDVTVRKFDNNPRIDGSLEQWKEAPQIALLHPSVEDLKVLDCAAAWNNQNLYLMVRVEDSALVNSGELGQLANGDCFEFRLKTGPENKFVRITAAPASSNGEAAFDMRIIDAATGETDEVLVSETAPYGENLGPARCQINDSGLRVPLAPILPNEIAKSEHPYRVSWYMVKEAKQWRFEAVIRWAVALTALPVRGLELPFVAVVWDRDRADVDEWAQGSGWRKRAESSSQKKPMSEWPLLVLGDENVRAAVTVKSGLQLIRNYPCNLYLPGQDVVVKWKIGKGMPNGGGKSKVVLKDAFGKKVLEKEGHIICLGGRQEFESLNLGILPRGYYEGTLSVEMDGANGGIVQAAENFSLGVMEQCSYTAEEFLKQDRRFGLKWWGGVTDYPETMEMMCRLGLQWTRAITGEAVMLTTNRPINTVVKIERFPKDLYDEVKYGPLPEWEQKFGRGAWTLKTVPKKQEYKKYLAESLKALPANQTVFEIWNEPWDKMSPEDFSIISGWIAAVVHKERPGAILGPNLLGDISKYGYDARVIEAGGMKGMSMVCLHPYGASENRQFMRDYKKWISEKCGRDITIYITEYGTHSTPEGPARQSELHQAASVVRQSLALYAEDCKALIPHWVGQSERNRTYHEDWFGYIRRNQQPKPVLLALANAARVIDGAKYCGDLWFGPGADAMVFEKDGVFTLALFARGEPREVTVEGLQPGVKLCNLLGTELPVDLKNGRLTLTVSSETQYLIGVPAAVVKDASPELRPDRYPPPPKPPKLVREMKRLSAPDFDGVPDEWKGAKEIYFHNPKVNGDDASGSAFLGWDDNYFYIAVKIRDNEMINTRALAKLYQQDSLEIFVSVEPRDVNDGYGPNDFQLMAAPTSITGEAIVGLLTAREAGVIEPVEGAKFKFVKQDRGWSGEMALPWKMFNGFKPKTDSELAFEIRLNDADTSHERWKLDPLDLGERKLDVNGPISWSILKCCE